jgi:nucleotide-binding universal stress UspA family protein
MKKIVVGIDGSDSSKDALRWAVDEARLRGARVLALHAWEVPVAPPDVVPVPELDLAGLVTELQAGALKLVTETVEEIVGDDSTVPVEAVAVEGPAADTLVDAARDADLLVVGSRGLRGLARLLLGSVSLHCVQHAPCPVLVHRVRALSDLTESPAAAAGREGETPGRAR